MSEHAYPIEVKSDFLEKITHATPTQALAEFVWNGLDADATEIGIRVEFNELGAMSVIEVSDNGIGMPFSDAPQLFTSLGGSWKRRGAVTKKERRQLHGQDGRGRFKAFALGRVAEWDVTYDTGKGLSSFKVTMFANSMREVRIADEAPAAAGTKPGVVVRISELHKNFQALTSESGVQELTELLALYLTDYRGIAVRMAGAPLDPGKVIASRCAVSLSDITEESKNYEARLEIIEWRQATQRALYLCTDRRGPWSSLDASTRKPSYFISKIQPGRENGRPVSLGCARSRWVMTTGGCAWRCAAMRGILGRPSVDGVAATL